MQISKCIVLQVGPYLLDHDTIPEQREFFHSAYSVGSAKQFLSRDQDRWVITEIFCRNSYDFSVQTGNI